MYMNRQLLFTKKTMLLKQEKRNCEKIHFISEGREDGRKEVKDVVLLFGRAD